MSPRTVCEGTEDTLVGNETGPGNGTVVGDDRAVSIEASRILRPLHDFPRTRAVATDVDYRTTDLFLLSLHYRTVGLGARVPACVHRARPIAREEGDDVLVVDPDQPFAPVLSKLEERRVVAVVAEDEPVPELLTPADDDFVCVSVRHLEFISLAGRDCVELMEAARLGLRRTRQSRHP